MKGFFKLRLLPNKFPALHGLRAIGTFIVVIYHVTPRYIPQLVNLWFVMDLFFVLSGFLIGLILLNDIKKADTGITRFYLRRSIRIFPAYYTVLLLAAFLIGLTESQKNNFWKELFYLTNYSRGNYLMNWSWSLSLDEHFYLICPLMVLALNKLSSFSKKMFVLAMLWISCLVVRLCIFFRYDNYVWGDFLDAIYYPTHCRYDTLTAGLALAYFTFNYNDRIQLLFKKRHLQLISLITALSLLLFVMLMPYIFELGSYSQGLMFTFGMGSLTSIAYVSLFLYLIYVPSRLSKLLGHRYFLVLATLSYSFYLVHLFVQKYVTRPFLKYLGVDYPSSMNFIDWSSECIFTIIASLVLAYLLHLLIEKPCLKIRDHYLS